MLRTKELVPSVYYNQSRDFQFLGRTLDVVFNYLKMNIDLMSGLPLSDNLDNKLIPLLAKTLGFTIKHEYNTQDLLCLCKVFSELVRNKGTKQAIEKAVLTLMNSQNISGYMEVDVINNDSGDLSPYTIYIYLPSEVTDRILLEDLFDYILPAGYDYKFINSTKADFMPRTLLDVDNKLKLFNLNNDKIGKIALAPNNNNNIAKPDMISVEDGTVDTQSEIATTFTGRILGGKKITNDNE